MIFHQTGLEGAYLIEPERIEDDRGFFARTFCRREFEERGLKPGVAQCNLSYNRLEGTLRGMHYQVAPHQEGKLVRCVAGAIHDVILDLRPESPAYRRHFATTLSADNRHALYIPPGVAHGFLALENGTEVFYQMDQFYHPESAAGVRWNDPAFAIDWPRKPAVISERDASYPDFIA